MRSIVLLGLRGAGKSAVAREVARRLELAAHDLDPIVTALAGKSIARVFAEDGEPRFRELETRALRDVLSKPDRSVIAPGGGIVLRDENRALLAGSRAFLIYLAARPETLAARVRGDPSSAADRPALASGGALAEARALLRAREPLYRALAHATLETDALDVAAVAEQVIALERATPPAPAP